jgi:hypothetical protein
LWQLEDGKIESWTSKERGIYISATGVTCLNTMVGSTPPETALTLLAILYKITFPLGYQEPAILEPCIEVDVLPMLSTTMNSSDSVLHPQQ